MDFKVARFGEVKLSRIAACNLSITRAGQETVQITLPVRGELSVRLGSRRHESGALNSALVGRPFENVNHRVTKGVVLTLHLPMARLIERSSRLAGCSHRCESLLSEMAEELDLSEPLCAALARNMNAAIAEASSLDAIGLGVLAGAGFEALLLDLATPCLFPSVAKKLERLPLGSGPSVIWKARDYISEHAAEPIELSRLASELGVSMRAMQENFQRYFGLSPRDYIMECRLETARRLLLSGESGASVTAAAMASGFTDLGHFSAKYRDKFGELPSETLRVGKL